MSGIWDAIIVGGGAAGFFGAIELAAGRPGARVLIVERSARVLQKVRISGGGRCNVTHDCADPGRMAASYPRGHKALIGPLHRFGVRHTRRWFEARGVRLKTEADGRVFPTTDDSETIINCLTDAADQAGVSVRTGAPIVAIRPVSAGPDGTHRTRFELDVHDRADTSEPQLRAKSVLLATGGTRSTSGAAMARRLGHTLAPAVPSLFTFKIDDPRIDGLQGVSVDHAQISVRGEPLADAGPLLITHWGMSGPAILKVSAWGARRLHARDYRFEIDVDWAPGVDLEATFHELRSTWGKRQVGARSPIDSLPKRLWARLVAAANIDTRQRWAELPKTDSRALAHQISRGRFRVDGTTTHKDEFVTCGGVPTDEVDMRTLQSRQTDGLYVAGEVLDVDGVTGGYNFQNAWTTGYLAGQAMAERVG